MKDKKCGFEYQGDDINRKAAEDQRGSRLEWAGATAELDVEEVELAWHKLSA